VKDQGDAIRLARERLKRYRRGKLILGGTPSVKGLSRVEEFIGISDRRVFPVTCHECGDSHVLDWSNVSWQTSSGQAHPVYGDSLPDTAVYACPHCGSVWDDWQRQRNVLETARAAVDAGDPYCGWVPTVDTPGAVRGFEGLSELYVCMPGTSLADVVRDYLEAEHDAAQGDESGRIVFVNSKLGRPYEYSDEVADEEQLRQAAGDYSSGSIPSGGLLLTAGVDVQHDRLSVLLRVWGRSEESWLVRWDEIYADHSTTDREDSVWGSLDKILFDKYFSGALPLHVSAISIDSSDGATNDAVYHWVRTRAKTHRRIHMMAVKGSGAATDPEIFSMPRTRVDHLRPDRQSKADRHGVQVWTPCR